MKVTKDMIIADIIQENPEMIVKFMRFGMGCAACPSAQHETVEEAAMVHQVDVEKLLEELNREE